MPHTVILNALQPYRTSVRLFANMQIKNRNGGRMVSGAAFVRSDLKKTGNPEIGPQVKNVCTVFYCDS